MPIIANAKKALRQSKTRNARNSRVRSGVRQTIKQTIKTPTAAALTKLYSVIDKAVKRNIIHKNKAARIKSRLSKKIVTKKTPVKTAKSKPTATKKTIKK